MRKVFLFMMVSLDGYFETPDHDLSWHNTDDEFNQFVDEQNPTIGTILFGRRTYDMMASFWPSQQGNVDPTTQKFMSQTEKIVFSYEDFKADWENTRVVSKNASDEVRKLKAGDGKDIAIFGSNNFCVSLMPEGLVDEFRIMVNPVALAKGNSLFTGLSSQKKFKLIDRREFKNGNVLLTYQPA